MGKPWRRAWKAPTPRQPPRQPAPKNLHAGRAALQYYPLQQWALYLDAYDQYRFARLAAWLREREPDDTINFPGLVYKLSDSDVDRMLDGPPPPFGPNAMEQEHGSGGP